MFELSKSIPSALDLSLGSPCGSPPEAVTAAALDAIRHGGKYSLTNGGLDIREAVAAKLKGVNGINASTDDTVITAGVTGGLVLALASLLDPGDEVILLDPYFLLYPETIRLLGGRPVYVSTYPDWEIPIATVEAAVNARTKAIIVNTPNNPTGKVYSRSALEQLADVAARNDLVVIADEIYEQFVHAGEHVSIGSLYPQTVTLMGLSKSEAVGGWRIGYLHAPTAMVESIQKLQQILYVCAPTPAQAALRASLDLDRADLQQQYRQKNVLVRSFFPSCPGMEGAIYGFLPTPNRDADPFVRLLVERGVIAVAGRAFSKQNTHLRIMYGVDDETLERALTIIRRAMDEARILKGAM